MRILSYGLSVVFFLAVPASACDLGEANHRYRTYDAAFQTMKSHDDESITEYMSDQAKEVFRKMANTRNAMIRGEVPSISFPGGADRGKNVLMLLQGLRGRVPESAKYTIGGDDKSATIEYRWPDELVHFRRNGEKEKEVREYVRTVGLICRDQWLVDSESQSSEGKKESPLTSGSVNANGSETRREWSFPP